MDLDSEIVRVKGWLEELVGKRLNYISGRNFAIIQRIDWNDGGRLFVLRGGKELSIRFDGFRPVLTELLTGRALHIDTFLRASNNQRSVFETILIHLPPIGYMKGNNGRNLTANKVIQWMSEDIHELGETLDVSDDKYEALVTNFDNSVNFTHLPKPFLLLAGISGTGKTRFIREQAKVAGDMSQTYCLVSVRPDWHEPSDILGYVSRLNQSAEFVVTDVLRFFANAWRDLFDLGLLYEVEQSKEYGKRVVVNGNRARLASVRPFWLCLDEMNLAPVEQYFADYLAAIETRSWQWQGDYFSYFCEPLLKPALIAQVDNKDKLRCDLGLNGAEYDESWQYICEYGLSIPFNLIVAGTVNVDETTHGFSRKVIDRALSLDFGEFFPNDFDSFFEQKSKYKALSFPLLSNASLGYLPAIDGDGAKSIAFLKAVNERLKQTPFELAYRALNELLLAVITQNPQSEIELKAVWDDFMMYKVLPRIEGDADKLAQRDIDQSLLVKLTQVLAKEFASFWSKGQRPDLLRELIEGDDKTLLVKCRSRVKLEQMQAQLVHCGFTSFWP